MPASVEFSALCHTQITTVAKAVGADSTAVYLAESWNEQSPPNLTQIAVYPPPESVQVRADVYKMPQPLPGQAVESAGAKGALASPVSPPLSDEPAVNSKGDLLSLYRQAGKSDAASSQQLAIPLVHEGGVLGVLVGWRVDRPWQTAERVQMEDCARSLALACVLDQRGQWLQKQLAALNRTQTQQSDRFHELLHQLRNPLTAVKTFGKLLVKRLDAEGQNQSLAQNMVRESDRMQHILGYFDETLQAADQSRTEAPHRLPLLSPSEPEETDTAVETQAVPSAATSLDHFGGRLSLELCPLAPLLDPLVDSTRALAETAGKFFHVFYPEQASVVVADEGALVEIVSIFLENALKYSTAGTHLWLQWGIVHSQDPTLEGILVGDTGPGIPKADQPHIFERHYRGVQQSGGITGSGLGLAIAQDLAVGMGGKIEVHSPLSHRLERVPVALHELLSDSGTAFILWLAKGVQGGNTR